MGRVHSLNLPFFYFL